MNQRLELNKNLTIHQGQFYNGYSLQHQRGDLITEYLERINLVLNNALSEHTRVFSGRFDLRLPDNFSPRPNFMSRFFKSLNAKISADINKRRNTGARVHNTTLRYVWVREFTSPKPHYHVIIFLNYDTYNTLGNFKNESAALSGMFKQAWASALQLPLDIVIPLIHVPKNPVTVLWPGDPSFNDNKNEMFRRASYLAKVQAKYYGGEGRNIGYSLS